MNTPTVNSEHDNSDMKAEEEEMVGSKVAAVVCIFSYTEAFVQAQSRMRRQDKDLDVLGAKMHWQEGITFPDASAQNCAKHRRGLCREL